MAEEQKDKEKAQDIESKLKIVNQVEIPKEEVTEDELIKLDIDPLKVYCREDYVLNDQITITQPTIGQIVKFGEKNIYGAITPFISNPTSFRVQLWDAGIDWNKVNDFELFIMLVGGVNIEYSKFLFGDINFSLFKPFDRTNEDGSKEIVLYNQEQNIEIDTLTYTKMAKYIQYMFNSTPKIEKVKGKFTKREVIQEDRRKQEEAAKEAEKSNMLSMISFCLNHPGFKYKLDELMDVGIVQFMDSVKRLQVYESTSALLKGQFSGFVDVSKVDKNEFNFMRDL